MCQLGNCEDAVASAAGHISQSPKNNYSGKTASKNVTCVARTSD